MLVPALCVGIFLDLTVTLPIGPCLGMMSAVPPFSLLWQRPKQHCHLSGPGMLARDLHRILSEALAREVLLLASGRFGRMALGLTLTNGPLSLPLEYYRALRERAWCLTLEPAFEITPGRILCMRKISFFARRWPRTDCRRRASCRNAEINGNETD